MNLTVVLEKSDESGYMFSCPEIPGCSSKGETLEEGLEKIEEAIHFCLRTLEEEEIVCN